MSYLSFNLMLVFVVLTFDFYYSCDAGAVWSAGRCFAAGRARSESVFPVLCSGFFWEGGCADSNYCEVSFDLILVLFVSEVLFCGFDRLFLHLSLRFCWLFDEAGYTARYLALKIGTNSKVFDLIGLLCCRWFMIWSGAAFSWVLFNKCYFIR